MNEWCDSQKKRNSNFRELLQEQIDKANPRRKLTAEETKRLAKLEAISNKLKRGENVQNRQLQTWLSEEMNVSISKRKEWQGYSRRSYKTTTNNLTKLSYHIK